MAENHIISFIKQHPYATAGSIFAAGALILVLNNSGNTAASSTTSSDGTTTAEVDAAAALQQSQLQYNLQNNAINAQVSEQAASVGGQEYVANLEATTSQNNNYVNDQSSVAIAGLQAQVAEGQTAEQQAVSTLSAQVADAQIQASVNEAQINSNTALGINAQNVQEVADITGAQVQESQIQSNQALGIAQINSNTIEHGENVQAGSNFFGNILGDFL